MPRKNPRPAARKEREKLKAKMERQKAKKPRVGMIVHTPYGAAKLALAAQMLNETK